MFKLIILFFLPFFKYSINSLPIEIEYYIERNLSKPCLNNNYTGSKLNPFPNLVCGFYLSEVNFSFPKTKEISINFILLNKFFQIYDSDLLQLNKTENQIFSLFSNFSSKTNIKISSIFKKTMIDIRSSKIYFLISKSLTLENLEFVGIDLHITSNKKSSMTCYLLNNQTNELNYFNNSCCTNTTISYNGEKSSNPCALLEKVNVITSQSIYGLFQFKDFDNSTIHNRSLLINNCNFSWINVLADTYFYSMFIEINCFNSNFEVVLNNSNLEYLFFHKGFISTKYISNEINKDFAVFKGNLLIINSHLQNYNFFNIRNIFVKKILFFTIYGDYSKAFNINFNTTLIKNNTFTVNFHPYLEGNLAQTINFKSEPNYISLSNSTVLIENNKFYVSKNIFSFYENNNVLISNCYFEFYENYINSDLFFIYSHKKNIVNVTNTIFNSKLIIKGSRQTNPIIFRSYDYENYYKIENSVFFNFLSGILYYNENQNSVIKQGYLTMFLLNKIKILHSNTDNELLDKVPLFQGIEYFYLLDSLIYNNSRIVFNEYYKSNIRIVINNLTLSNENITTGLRYRLIYIHICFDCSITFYNFNFQSYNFTGATGDIFFITSYVNLTIINATVKNLVGKRVFVRYSQKFTIGSVVIKKVKFLNNDIRVYIDISKDYTSEEVAETNYLNDISILNNVGLICFSFRRNNAILKDVYINESNLGFLRSVAYTKIYCKNILIENSILVFVDYLTNEYFIGIEYNILFFVNNVTIRNFTINTIISNFVKCIGSNTIFHNFKLLSIKINNTESNSLLNFSSNNNASFKDVLIYDIYLNNKNCRFVYFEDNNLIIFDNVFFIQLIFSSKESMIRIEKNTKILFKNIRFYNLKNYEGGIFSCTEKNTIIIKNTTIEEVVVYGNLFNMIKLNEIFFNKTYIFNIKNIKILDGNLIKLESENKFFCIFLNLIDIKFENEGSFIFGFE